MASIFDILAEQRILDAERNGDFANLPGAGRPLVFDDELFVSPEQRMVNKVRALTRPSLPGRCGWLFGVASLIPLSQHYVWRPS